MNPSYIFLFLALGAGLILVAEIAWDGWKSRQDRRRARLGSIRQLRDIPEGRTRVEAILADFVPRPAQMTADEIADFNRERREG